ncbi:hypothetical protein ABT346_25195 [Micromonospora peucetia]|uniref:hypothetical protein n=1 Tax=Micromonospora peucetia TaxID=47871 RepID=UPI00332C0E51
MSPGTPEKEELDRAKGSALRHLMQWLCGEDDEDHAAAVVFNIMAAEFVRYQMRGGAGEVRPSCVKCGGTEGDIVLVTEEYGYRHAYSRLIRSPPAVMCLESATARGGDA